MTLSTSVQFILTTTLACSSLTHLPLGHPFLLTNFDSQLLHTRIDFWLASFQCVVAQRYAPVFLDVASSKQSHEGFLTTQ